MIMEGRSVGARMCYTVPGMQYTMYWRDGKILGDHRQNGMRPIGYKGRFKRSEFLFQNVRISGYVNTESIWSLQT